MPPTSYKQNGQLPAQLPEFLAGEEGFEPSHAGIKIRCLNQLGDSPTRTPQGDPYGGEARIISKILRLHIP